MWEPHVANSHLRLMGNDETRRENVCTAARRRQDRSINRTAHGPGSLSDTIGVAAESGTAYVVGLGMCELVLVHVFCLLWLRERRRDALQGLRFHGKVKPANAAQAQ